ncbi:hypothetical protein B0H10DRAFT_2012537 [Mycena sp. CBHHK59/15]|nr:hypothetical protein B0H10DRAFT_2012537 [Mycena sp. CBHHK59/15]
MSQNLLEVGTTAPFLLLGTVLSISVEPPIGCRAAVGKTIRNAAKCLFFVSLSLCRNLKAYSPIRCTHSIRCRLGIQTLGRWP